MVKRSILSENTLIPVSFVITIGTGIYFFSRLMFATDAHGEDIAELQSSIKSMQQEVIIGLRDQSASLAELRSQVIMLDTKLSSVSERLNRMAEREKKP